MAKPINWDLVTSLMIKYYPKEYQRSIEAQQTRLDLSSLDPPKKGKKRRASGSHRHAPERQAYDQRR